MICRASTGRALLDLCPPSLLAGPLSSAPAAPTATIETVAVRGG
jgi:hypothetical protein